MNFRKIISIKKATFGIDHQSEIISLGSCFSEHIGNKLKSRRFCIVQNPNGIIFNPIALAKVFANVDTSKIFSNEYGDFCSWNHHSTISHATDLKTLITDIDLKFKNKLKTASHIFVTFGSAWGYILKEDNSIVANCHKMQADLFNKELASVSQIVDTWKAIIVTYPHIQWIFTVSPVRHWKDGVRENNVSKGILHQSINELLQLDNASYFSSYEILLDELRDYRFYKNDFLHPNDMAIDYIWQRFGDCYFDSETQDLNKKVAKLIAMKNHKIMNASSKESKKFEGKLTALASEINTQLKEGQKAKT